MSCCVLLLMFVWLDGYVSCSVTMMSFSGNTTLIFFRGTTCSIHTVLMEQPILHYPKLILDLGPAGLCFCFPGYSDQFKDDLVTQISSENSTPVHFLKFWGDAFFLLGLFHCEDFSLGISSANIQRRVWLETRLTKESRPIGWRKREKREGGRVTEQEKKKKKKRQRQNDRTRHIEFLEHHLNFRSSWTWKSTSRLTVGTQIVEFLLLLLLSC